jgi:mannose-6-phosphate isomerase-like protein (cupin superfamily)
LAEVEGKEKEEDTMSSKEDQAQKEYAANGAPAEGASRIFALDPGEGEALWWMGGLATVKATAEQTGGRYTLVEVLVPEFPMEESLLHVHHFEDEGFYILEGEMTFYVGEQTIKARSGSFLFGPKDIPHAFSVDSGPARLLFILSPAGMEGLIREMGEPARSLSIPPPPEEPPDEAEMGRLMAIAAEYGGEMLGPPPSR